MPRSCVNPSNGLKRSRGSSYEGESTSARSFHESQAPVIAGRFAQSGSGTRLQIHRSPTRVRWLSAPKYVQNKGGCEGIESILRMLRLRQECRRRVLVDAGRRRSTRSPRAGYGAAVLGRHHRWGLRGRVGDKRAASASGLDS